MGVLGLIVIILSDVQNNVYILLYVFIVEYSRIRAACAAIRSNP